MDVRAGPDDYIFGPTTLTFGPQSGLRLCADIELVDDDIPDGKVETFMYKFSTLTDRVILPQGGNITIVDDERELHHNNGVELTRQYSYN